MVLLEPNVSVGGIKIKGKIEDFISYFNFNIELCNDNDIQK